MGHFCSKIICIQAKGASLSTPKYSTDKARIGGAENVGVGNAGAMCGKPSEKILQTASYDDCD